MTANQMIHLDVRQKGCVLEVWLNDIPVLRVDNDNEGFISIPIHSYLLDRINVLEVVLGTGLTPSRSRAEPPAQLPGIGSHCQVSLTRYEVGGTVGENGQPLISVSWPSRERGDGRFPLVLRAQGDLGPMFGPPCWQNARVLNPVSDGGRILETLAYAHQAFQTGDGAALVGLCPLYFKDEANAYPAWSFEQLRGRMMRSVVKNAEAGTVVAPLNPAEFDLRYCAGGRLVECVDRMWRPLLRAEGQNGKRRYPLSLFLGEVNGRVQVLR